MEEKILDYNEFWNTPRWFSVFLMMVCAGWILGWLSFGGYMLYVELFLSENVHLGIFFCILACAFAALGLFYLLWCIHSRLVITKSEIIYYDLFRKKHQRPWALGEWELFVTPTGVRFIHKGTKETLKTFFTGYSAFFLVREVEKQGIPYCRTAIEAEIKNNFHFLLNDYGFQFAQHNLGDYRDEAGKLLHYGPLDCYSLYNDVVCIHVLHLVQREDRWIRVTDGYTINQTVIEKGISPEEKYAYDLSAFAECVQKELMENGEIMGYKITSPES